MVKFNIHLLMIALEQELASNSAIDALKFDLTVRPSKPDVFTSVPVSNRATYLQFISMAYKISFMFASKLHFECYLFVRNGLDAYGSCTKISSFELGYFDRNEFKPFFKAHLGQELILTANFNSFAEMKEAVRDVRNILHNKIFDEAVTQSLN
jgi:hypothetical protein